MTFGFIITRHVINEMTNHYWNQCVKLLNLFYPTTPIVIIDDNSKYDFVHAQHEHKNLTIVQSAYPARGELLPFIYLLRDKYFDNAVFLHDSVFIHNKIDFQALIDDANINVLPLWHFNADNENGPNLERIAGQLNQSHQVQTRLLNQTVQFPLSKQTTDKWFGCFGVQCFIRLSFLEHLERKYSISRLVNAIHNRSDRCGLERIFGILFAIEHPEILQRPSLFGNILTYQRWGYNYELYQKNIANNCLPRKVVKIWTGR